MNLKTMSDEKNAEDLLEKRKEKIESFELNIESEKEYFRENNSENINTSEDLENPEIDNIVNYVTDDNTIHSYSDIESSKSALEDTEHHVTKLKSFKKAEKRRKKEKARKNGCLFRMVWLVMIVLVSVVLAQYIMVGVNDMLAINRTEEKTVTITIPKDATLDQISDILYNNKIISNKTFFKFYATFTKATSGFTQGTFDMETNRDYQSIINFMQSDMNRTDVVTIQFTEGMSILEYAALLEKNQVCSSEDFLNACNSDHFDEDYAFLQDMSNVKNRCYKLEGYLFPDTYNFYIGEDPYSAVRKFLSNYTQKIYYTKSRVEGFEQKVTIEERAKAIGMTVDEVINLASLIQAEAANKEDMYIVSSILHNRLDTIKNGGESPFGDGGLNYLQLDSTIYYPYRSLNKVPAAIRKSFKSTYNTYKTAGLPYGAICNPGLDAIEAALAPADTKYYYFCHKAATEEESAQSYYASTMEEHQNNLVLAGLV